MLNKGKQIELIEEIVIKSVEVIIMNLKALPNFKIRRKGKVSDTFLLLGINEFHQAVEFVGHLPYGRNTSGTEYELVLSERKGTCSTKHALLSALCIEQGTEEIKLFTGIYEMNENNTPGVGNVLRKYGLSSIPEAHCYLKHDNYRFDFTRLDVQGEPIEEFLVEEQLEPNQIGDFKKNFHRSYIAVWLINQELKQKFNLDSLWKVREECIKELSAT
jgi:hypothetical protein